MVVAESKPYIKRYTPEMSHDIYKINFDAVSLIEIMGVSLIEDPHNNVSFCLSESTQAWILYDPLGNPDGALGIIDSDGVGIPWFLHSGKVTEKYPREFWEGSKKIMKGWTETYKEMINYVWIGHDEAHSWLERLGFTVDKRSEHSFTSPHIKFYKFYYKRD